MIGKTFSQRAAAFFQSILLCSLPVLAWADYSVELNVTGIHQYLGEGTSFDSMRYQGSLYLPSVSTEEVPLKEAAFLARASSLTIEHEDSELETPVNGSDIKTDSDYLQLGYQGIYGNYIVGAFYGEGEDNKVDFKQYGIEGGLYINDRTSLTLSISRDDIDQSPETYEEYKINLRSVVQNYEGNDIAGRFSAGVSESAIASTIVEFGGEFDYFFTRAFSIGGGFDLNIPNGDVSTQHIYTFKTDYFITENIAVGAKFSLTKFQAKENDVDDPDFETYAVTLTGRI